MGTEETINFKSLLVADERDNTEACRLPSVIFLVFGLLNSGGKERGNGKRFLAIDLAIAAGALSTIGNRMRPEMHPAGVAQRLDTHIVRNHVAELNDFGDA